MHLFNPQINTKDNSATVLINYKKGTQSIFTFLFNQTKSNIKNGVK